VGGDGEAQDAVSEERESLVGLGAVVDPRRVREGLPNKVFGELIEEGLECVRLGAQDAVSGACAAT
jgi:hypothetical protein